MQSVAFAALALSAGVSAQLAGTNTAEVHPKLTVSKCAAGGSCTVEQHSVVLDANWRWLHSASGYTNCYSGNTWDATLCPDPTTCAKNCALDGADYPGTYGIKASGNSLSLQLVTGTNSGSRVYLMDTADSKYQQFNLLAQEFTFDVDVSKLPCGLNGALYFSQMDADGGASKYPTNKAGAKYGTGYCDSQCPKDIKFIEGKANIDGWTTSGANTGKGTTGICCSEMDIWEANSISAAYTPHPCQPEAYTPCTGDACTSTCDQAGCDFNSYRMGNTTFYGPGMTIDTTKKFTVVTQFLTSDGTASGDLTEIKRYYVQNGVTYANSQSNIAGVSGNSLTTETCAAQKSAFGDSNTFQAEGGLKAMGEAFKAGMTLVLSIWDDTAVNMLWLDAPYPASADPSAPGVTRGTCSPDSGKPADVESQSPGSTVIFSNIKTGPIGSTFNSAGTDTGSTNPGTGSGSSSSVKPSSTSSVKPSSTSSVKPTTTTVSVRPTTTTVKTTTTTARPTTTTASSSNCAAKYAQCGGQGWAGSKCCASGSTCKVSNQYYSQCL